MFNNLPTITTTSEQRQITITNNSGEDITKVFTFPKSKIGLIIHNEEDLKPETQIFSVKPGESFVIEINQQGGYDLVQTPEQTGLIRL